ncbi:MAG: hypothetical protein AAF515_11820 [Pseudomonadota bacterium]
MLIGSGEWIGQGRFVVQGQSLGVPVKVRFRVQSDEHGEHFEGSLTTGDEPAQQEDQAFAVRVLPDDSGTYDVTASGPWTALSGTGKLESEPNLTLLWADDASVSASVALFRTGTAIGCRGFYRRDGGVVTWEVALERKSVVPTGGNVVTLRRRR